MLGEYTVTFDSDLTARSVATGSDTTNQVDMWARVSTDDPTRSSSTSRTQLTPVQQDNEFFLHVVC